VRCASHCLSLNGACIHVDESDRARQLFKDGRFILLAIAGAIGTFPLLVPPFFIPLYAETIGLTRFTGALLLAGWNLASAVGRLGFGLVGDRIGPVNSLLLSFIFNALSMLAIWPVSTSLGPLAVFVIINGISNGGFFSIMPTVVGAVFGPSLRHACDCEADGP
jgi:MFS family permease